MANNGKKRSNGREHDVDVIDDEDRQVERAVEQRNERTRRYLDLSTDRSQEAVRAYIRAMNDAITALVPRAFFRPGMVIRTQFEVLGQLVDIQRAMWDELVQVWNEDTRRAVRRDERVDYDQDWERQKERIGR